MPAASVALFAGLFVIPDPVIGSLVLLVLGLPVELLLEAGMSGDGGARGGYSAQKVSHFPPGN